MASHGEETNDACDPPVYAATTPSSDSVKQIEQSNQLHIDAVPSILAIRDWSVSANTVPPRRPPATQRAGPRDIFAVSARLRI